MIIPQSKVNTVDTNMEGATSFSIKASAKAFKILSDGLYSDKIRAVIRELSCNALDSHTAAGCPDRPIYVHIPNTLEPWFSVRDEGLGLSKEDVLKLYTTYFESTKAESNDQIGALGLGSKSPFSYTDSFTVVSRYNGMESLYTAYINEYGQPSIQHIMDVETSELNGVEVKFGVSTNDIKEFTTKSALVYRAFKVHPIINGNPDFKQESRGTILLSGDGWEIYEGSNKRQYAVQGNIEYPISISNVTVFSEKASFVLSQNIFIDFKIGELDIAASREQLGYDQVTIANIIKRCDTIFDEIITAGNKSIANCTNMWDASYNCKKMTSQLYKGDQYLKFVWNDVEVKDSFEVDRKQIFDLLKIYRSSRYKLGYKRETDVNYIYPTTNKNTVFLYMDDNYNRNKVKANVKHWLKNNDVYLFIFSNKQFLNYVGNPNYMTYSVDIPEAPKAESKSSSYDKSRVHPLGCNFKRYHRNYYNTESEFCSKYSYITDIAHSNITTVYYVPVVTNSVINNELVTAPLNYAKYTGMIDDTTSMLVGIKKSMLEDKKWLEKLESDKRFKFIDFRKAVKDNLSHILDRPLLKQVLRPIKIMDSINIEGVKDYRLINFKKEFKLDEKSHFYNIVSEVEDAKGVIKAMDMSDTVISYINSHLTCDKLSVNDMIYSKYPMLQFVSDINDSRHKHKVLDYINFVDSVNIKNNCDTITDIKKEEVE